MMGDLFSYLLSGCRGCEYTNASTTQLLDPRTRTWCEPLMEKLEIPRRLFLGPNVPGTSLGPLLGEVARQTGVSPATPVIATATHDTGAAIAAVPAVDDSEDWAYLSSGTWSLLGAELDQPIVDEQSYTLNFTNEGGVGSKIRFLKNISGLWLLQECRRSFGRDGPEIGYEQMVKEAAEAEPFRTVINPDDPSLLAPEDMPGAIRELARTAGLPVPETRGALVRCALESLALKYRGTVQELDSILGRRTQRLHVIGGGVRNRLLCQMTADACGIPVLAGPVEATALGNILVQALATGTFASLADARRAVFASVEIVRYEPRNTSNWDRLAEQTRG
jgi:rhamnulokinase